MIDILSLNNNNGCVVSTKSISDHFRRPGSDSSWRSYWPLVLLWIIYCDNMFRLGVVITIDAKGWSSSYRLTRYACWLQYIVLTSVWLKIEQASISKRSKSTSLIIRLKSVCLSSHKRVAILGESQHKIDWNQYDSSWIFQIVIMDKNIWIIGKIRANSTVIRCW